MAALAVALSLAQPAAAAPPELEYACSPGPADCGGWYRAAVTLRWNWNQLTASETSPGDCAARTFTADTPGAQESCEVSDGSSSTKHTVTIRLDATPPRIVGAALARPPDHGAWHTRPVSLSFQGSDDTSGVQSCDTVTYGGPDGPAVGVAGTCRDVAGNIGSGTFPLSYDATPPALREVNAAVGDGFALLSWRAAPDTERIEVFRSPGPAGAVFSGAATAFRDRSARNGVRYGYTVVAFDRAGNSTRAGTSARPAAGALVRPLRNARLSRPPRLRWKRAGGAGYYNVQVFRGRRKVLSAWPRGNRLQLRSRWRFEGRIRRLSAGRYRWYVWPGYGPRSQRRYGRPLGQSSFVVR